MCIKNHTHCSVESVTERRQQPLHCRQSVNRSTGCRNLKHHTRLPRTSEDRGTPFHDGLKTCCSETSTVQHIRYNANRAVWNPLILRKLLSNTYPGAPLPLPRPPKKKSNNPPKNVSPSNLPSPVNCPRDRSHRLAPIRDSSASDPCKGFPPKTSKRPRVDTIKNASVEPSCHRVGTSTGSFQQSPRKERNRDVCPSNRPGLSVHWPQSGG
jgi:hypothetical protein